MGLHSCYRLPRLHVLILAAAVALVPVPGLAGDNGQSQSTPPGIKASIGKAVAAQAKAANPDARAVSAVAAQATGLSSPGFFKTRAGVVTLVALAAGAGYALYSTSHDRVKSPNRTYGGGQ